ncbi:uncharacterized protein B0I36DRAFT_332742 [Microdochium trichocladiopsis]|uniref:Peptidase metallopeptidase domain-containing protein n=1 Tax=Microdochium trichocladiopsis TaxID=1682393 RepID=A0A9P8XZ60_9PEZI|nr:uncharacterized protein B0I36DRAFT_332742 [Microdochium trichocladiopsis]KAH7025219.1 hypothetical protein B0I36DRAFT_332742 [Microdochium trichocladiopsis]
MSQSEQRLTMNMRGARDRQIQLLKKKAGADLTIPVNPEPPENIRKMLDAGSSALGVPQSKYTCFTQEEIPVPPAVKSDPLGIWLGWGGSIPRWQRGEEVRFAALRRGYPTSNHATFAAYKLNEAAKMWNDAKVGVTFKWVDELEKAAFVLAYGGDQGGVLAKAFFPNSNDLNTLFVYQKAFDTAISPYQTNIFLHELGHVLGLRHEFAAQEGGAVAFGSANPRSVMSYTFPPNIRDSDKKDTQDFYNYEEETLRGLQIVDFIPN